MPFKGRSLYLGLTALWVAGLLYYAVVPGNFCFFSNITSIPCPSCGATRSMALILEGKLWEALKMNPLGIAVMVAMAGFPLWMLYDLVLGEPTLHKTFRKAETIVRRKWVAGLLILLALANWAWNICKGL